MKIAVVSTTTYPTPPWWGYGGEVYFYDLACALSELGADVTLYGAPGSLPPSPRGRLRYLPGSYGEITWADASAAVELHLPEILSHDKIIDCGHNHMVAEQIWWYHRKRRGDVCIVPNGVVSVYPRCGPFNMVVGSNKWADLLIYGRSEFIGTPFAEVYGDSIPPVPEDRIAAMIPWACNTRFYTPGDAPPEDWFLFLGRPTPYKGISTALEGVTACQGHLKLIVGLGNLSHRQELEQAMPMIEETRKKGATVDIIILPNDSRHHLLKRDYLRRAKALLQLITRHEPFGLAAIEALACGTPVIGSRMGAIPEIIQDGKTGRVCSNMEETAAAMKKIGEISREECRRDAEARWDRLRAGREFLKLLEEGQPPHD